MPYLLDHSWEHEHARLSILAQALDPYTIRHLETIGVTTGWRCLEVGGGIGTIAQWLSQRVGSTGYVLVTDLECDFLEAIASPNLEVRQHNICIDPLEANSFDLVHSRAVLEHMPFSARQAAINNMLSALKPGGWLCIEDGDTITVMPASPYGQELFTHCVKQFEQFLISKGAVPHYGRMIRSELATFGLQHLHAEGALFEWGGDLPQTAIWVYNYQRLQSQIVAAGLLSAEDVAVFLDLLQTPDFRAFSPVLMSVWGQKPPIS
jgi:SAM-dependent methyltransferase